MEINHFVYLLPQIYSLPVYGISYCRPGQGSVFLGSSLMDFSQEMECGEAHHHTTILWNDLLIWLVADASAVGIKARSSRVKLKYERKRARVTTC